MSVAAVAPPKDHYHKNTPLDVLFRCECGAVIKVKVKSIKLIGVPETCGKKCPLGPLLVPRKPRKRAKHRPQFKVFGMTYKELSATYKQEFKVWVNHRKRWCKRWMKSWEWFIYDMGPKPPGLVLCKRDLKKKHSPENSYWDHYKSDYSKLTWQGYKVTKGWASKWFGINKIYIDHRIQAGQTRLEDIIERYDGYLARKRLEAKQAAENADQK